MTGYALIVILALTVFFFSLISNKIHKTIITLPIAFTLAGFLFGPDVLNFVDFPISSVFIRYLAETTLILVLYSDASRIQLKSVQKYHNIPIRLLLVGLPLAVLFGSLFAKACFSSFSWFDAALLSAILAPTDAALIHTVVSYKKVPMRIRQALNIESGLNDGLMVPVIIGLLSFIDSSREKLSVYSWIWFLLAQIAIGTLIGFITGYFGAKACEYGIKKKWMSRLFEELCAIAIAFLAYGLAQTLTGNGFIAAFVCGLTIGRASKAVSSQVNNFAAAEGQLLVLVLFFFFGSSFLNQMFVYFSWQIFLYAIFSLTIIRMSAVFLSIIGCHLRFESFLYLGWFGPRGVASIVFAFLLVETIENNDTNIIFTTAITTIFLSIFLHGISSLPFAKWYSKRLQTKKHLEEHRTVTEIPTRLKL